MNSTAALRGATVVLGDRAILKALDLEIRPGVTVVRGPNGSGKTTLLRALAGLVALSRGTREAPPRALYLGQRAGLLRGLSARDNLRFLASFRGDPVERVGPSLAAWGIAARLASRPVESLSAGEQKRAALARIDVEPCDLVLLDEPFGEIDDAAATQLLRTIRRLAGERRSVVIATHGRFELDGWANEVVRLA